MEMEYYRGVFSWPSQRWINRERATQYDTNEFSPEDLGIQIVNRDHDNDIRIMVKEAMEKGEDEPICVFDMNSVVEKFYHWRESFPRVRPYFAVKVYDDPAVISLLDQLGAGFDCASKSELSLLVGKLNVNPQNIIYANAIKAPTHMQFAANNGVSLMTFDCQEELSKIKKIFPNARLVLRLDPLKTGDVEWPLSKKFGCVKKEIRHLFQMAKKLNLEVVGVCFHAGSGIDEADAYVINIEAAKKAFDIGQQEGFHLQLLDIGGGYFGNTGSLEKLEKMSGPINEALDAHFPASSGVSIISEPGRYFVESGLKLAACVIGKKAVQQDKDKDEQKDETLTKNSKSVLNKCHDKDDNNDAKFAYFISASVFGILNYNVYFDNFDYHPTAIFKNGAKRESELSVLWGPSCDSIDKIQKNRDFPELEIGDWLLFDDVGAYSISVSTTFNGFTPCERVRRIIQPDTWKSIFLESTTKHHGMQNGNI